MSTTVQASEFRDDINGLRAWAVAAVLLFHFQVPGFSAGFIGVDIFFVISGFLMTGIVLRGLENGNFSLWHFYMARARRIIPALMLLIVVLLVLGWFWLLTPDYQSLGSQSAYSLSFLSNIHFWRSAGYFDSAAHEKWLLHTWSLGIEMQFYILYPVFALVVWKIRAGITAFTWSLVALFVVSLALSIIASSWKPVAAFYLLPTRGWELAAGGLVFLLSRNQEHWKQYGSLLYGVGLLLWGVGFSVIDSSFPWPSGWALLPVIGTGLIILASQNDARLMVNPLAGWLGNISYSLYLWHWPLVVALYFLGVEEQWLWVVAGLLLSLLLGYISFKFIENPTRRTLTDISIIKQVMVFGAAGVLIGLAAVSVRLFSFDSRLPEYVEIASGKGVNTNPILRQCWADGSGNGSYGCPITLKSDVTEKGFFNDVVLKGDSHSLSVATALLTAADSYGLDSVEYWGMSGCHSIVTGQHSNESGRNPIYCKELNDRFFEEVKDKIIVIVDRTNLSLYGFNGKDESNKGPWISFQDSNFTDLDFEGVFQREYVRSACLLSERNRVFLMRPIPEMIVSPPLVLARSMLLNREYSEVTISRHDYDVRNSLVWKAQDEAAEKCGVRLLNPLPYLCDAEYCYGSREGKPLYEDDDHLNEYGNKLLIPMFEEIFNN